MRNHSVTHLMHKALREVLGDHVQQKGSLVDPDKTRFDFAHNQPVTDGQIREIERRVNAEILANQETLARVMDIEAAQKTGAVMLFGEKYGDRVRVLDIGSSRELCGGTHVRRTGDIGLFKIVGEGAVAAGVRRLEALTGAAAEAHVAAEEQQLGETAALLKAPPAELAARVAALLDERRRLERELADQRRAMATGRGAGEAPAREIAGVKLATRLLDGVPAKELKAMADALKQQLGSGVVALVAREGGRASLVVAVTARFAFWVIADMCQQKLPMPRFPEHESEPLTLSSIAVQFWPGAGMPASK
jgi:alanyl-tRNA synthetase